MERCPINDHRVLTLNDEAVMSVLGLRGRMSTSVSSAPRKADTLDAIAPSASGADGIINTVVLAVVLLLLEGVLADDDVVVVVVEVPPNGDSGEGSST